MTAQKKKIWILSTVKLQMWHCTEGLVGGDDNIIAGQGPRLYVTHLLRPFVVEHFDVLGKQVTH